MAEKQTLEATAIPDKVPNRENTEPFLLTKHRQGKPLGSEEKRMVFNLFTTYSIKNKSSRTENVNETASSLGVSRGTVWRVIREVETTGQISSPPKEKVRRPGVHLGRKFKFDEEQKDQLRRIINNFFKNNQIPTMDKIYKMVQEDESFPRITKVSLYNYMKRLGFKYEKNDKNQFVLTKP